MNRPVRPADLPQPYVEMLSFPQERGGAVWLGRCHAGVPVRIGMHHRHAELEVNLILRGHGAYLLGGERFALDPGTLVWLPAGRDHCLVERSADFRMHIVVWTPAVVRGLPARHPLRGLAPPAPRRLPARRFRAVQAVMEDLAEVDEPAIHRTGIIYLLQRLWNAWSEAPVAGPATAIHPAVIAAAHALAGDGEWSTADLARRLGVGAGHLARIFRAEMGLSLVEYRNRRRLDRVMDGWMPGRSLMRLALDAGFGSYAQFNRMFHRQFGCSPQRWVAERT